MNLKDNISMVKEELNSEEKFFEKAVVTERFIKKYKNIMLSVVAVFALGVVANVAYDMNEESKKASSNAAFLKLSADANDGASLSDLKNQNPELYEVWSFSKALANKDLESLKKFKESKIPVIGDLAQYETSQKASELDGYAMKQDAIFKDLALVQSGVLLINENKIKEAHEKLSKVSKDSSLSKLATALMHYGIK